MTLNPASYSFTHILNKMYVAVSPCRMADIETFIKLQDKEMEEFVAEREKLIKEHEETVKAMKRRHWEEEVELEKEFNAELTILMDKYSPKDAPERN